MSYHIFYDKQFIKVDENHVIPFYLGGDNNVTVGSGREEKRARDWSNSYAHTMGNMIVSNTDLLANIDQYREQTMKRAAEQVLQYDESWAYDDKAWGYHTSLCMYGHGTRTTSFNAYKSFFKNGIKNALTIEQLREQGVTITMRPYRWEDADILGKGLEIKPDVTFSSTEHMVAAIKEYSEYYDNHGVSLYLTECGMDWFMRQKKHVNRQKKYDRNREKTAITVQEYYVLALVNNEELAFIKNTARGYKYSYFLSGGKSFINEKVANTFLKRLRNKQNFVVKKVAEPKVFRIFAS